MPNIFTSLEVVKSILLLFEICSFSGHCSDCNLPVCKQRCEILSADEMGIDPVDLDICLACEGSKANVLEEARWKSKEQRRLKVKRKHETAKERAVEDEEERKNATMVLPVLSKPKMRR